MLGVSDSIAARSLMMDVMEGYNVNNEEFVSIDGEILLS